MRKTLFMASDIVAAPLGIAPESRATLSVTRQGKVWRPTRIDRLAADIEMLGLATASLL